MNRLVYSPKAYVFVQTQESAKTSQTSPHGGYLDLSDYVVRGTVNRVIDSASTAEITLRNPGRKWTHLGAATFHPMDKITIWLARFRNKPVQVFTGYLDGSTYYNLYPGTITLRASCTLKRLLHTYWDIGLPHTMTWLQQHGWYPDPQSGQMVNQHELVRQLGDPKKGKLTDGSIGSLLYSLLTDKQIGNWADGEVHIESLPTDLSSKMLKVVKSFYDDRQILAQDLGGFLSDIIGSGAYGSGSGTGGAATSTGYVTGDDKIVPVMVQISNAYNVPPELTVAAWIVEWRSSNNTDTPGNPHYGYFQQQIANPPYSSGTMSGAPPTLQQTHDLGIATTGFVTAAAGVAQNNPALRQNTFEWVRVTQGVVGTQQAAPYMQQGAWDQVVATARSLITQYGAGSATTTGSSSSSGHTAQQDVGKQGSKTGITQSATSRLDTLKNAAEELNNRHYPYAYGGGHNSNFSPSPDQNGNRGTGYDCSGSLSYVLHKAGYIDSPLDSSALMSFGDPGEGKVTIYANASHAWMTIDGRSFGTWNGGNVSGGPQWLPDPPTQAYISQFTARHPPDQSGPSGVRVTGGTTGTADTSNGTNPGGIGAGSTNGLASAFAVQLGFPSIEQTLESISLYGQKSLMNDKPLMPFVQQVAGASMRQFQSLPNGNFFAFFPDYFGEYNHRKPYWQIRDIEVLDGKIELTDDNLATHVYVVGDTGLPDSVIDLTDKMLSGGTMTIFDAFESEFFLAGKGKSSLLGGLDAVKFLQKYGARPHYEEASFVRSPYFEWFLALQRFQFLWSRTFLTEFQFTFMPELFPGGRVELADHGIQMYVDSVTHSFDYEAGFTTTAALSAPSATGDPQPGSLVAGMIDADFISDTTAKK